MVLKSRLASNSRREKPTEPGSGAPRLARARTKSSTGLITGPRVFVVHSDKQAALIRKWPPQSVTPACCEADDASRPAALRLVYPSSCRVPRIPNRPKHRKACLLEGSEPQIFTRCPETILSHQRSQLPNREILVRLSARLSQPPGPGKKTPVTLGCLRLFRAQRHFRGFSDGLVESTR